MLSSNSQLEKFDWISCSTVCSSIHRWSIKFPKLTVLANEMQVIQIATDIIPQPVPTAIQNNAILFAVIIVRLIFAPRRFRDNFSCITSTVTIRHYLRIISNDLWFYQFYKHDNRRCRIGWGPKDTKKLGNINELERYTRTRYLIRLQSTTWVHAA